MDDFRDNRILHFARKMEAAAFDSRFYVFFEEEVSPGAINFAASAIVLGGEGFDELFFLLFFDAGSHDSFFWQHAFYDVYWAALIKRAYRCRGSLEACL